MVQWLLKFSGAISILIFLQSCLWVSKERKGPDKIAPSSVNSVNQVASPSVSKEKPLVVSKDAQISDLSIFPRRLTPQEYSNMIVDIFGIDIREQINSFPLEASVSGFRNQYDSFKSSVQQIEWFFVTANKVSELVIAKALRDPLDSTCLEGNDPGCLSSNLEDWIRLLLRGELANSYAKELQSKFVSLAIQENSVKTALSSILVELLQSPFVLYRIFRNADVDGKNRLLGGIELASRLSFFLWHSVPDAELLRAAESGQLDNQEGRRTSVIRMLADAKAKRAYREFITEWLQLSRLDSINLDRTKYPNFSSEAVLAMKEETLSFFENIAFNSDKRMMSIFDFPQIVKPNVLEAIYSKDNKGNPVDVSKTRSGILTQASILTLTSAVANTDPVGRGHYLSSRFLCVTVPSPPMGITTLSPVMKSLTKKDRYEQHRSNPACSFCHQHMDVLGFPFENYDRNGVYRKEDEQDAVIDPKGAYSPEPGSELKFDDAVALAKLLARYPKAKECLVRRHFEYALGYSLNNSSEALALAVQTFNKLGGRFNSLIFAITESPSFLFTRKGE